MEKKRKEKKELQSSDDMMSSLISLTKKIEDLKSREELIYEMAARTILKALDTKDSYTYGHSMRVCYYSMVLGKQLGLDDKDMYSLQLSSLFHDIGKIGTPDSVLNKPTRLEPEEFLIMKKHPTLSYEILNEFEGFQKIAKFCLHHHERYDGRGYPDGLKGEEIPLISRIILIADTFDAMTSTRVYRKGLADEVAFEELQEFSGSQFDPKLVEVFIKAMREENKQRQESFYIPILDKSFKKDAA